MKKLVAILCSALTITACNRDSENLQSARLPDVTAEVVYEENETDEDPNARVAVSTNQSVAFQNITNDLTFAQAYTWKAWHFGNDEPTQANRFDGSAIDQLGDDKRDKPTYTVTKSNLRLFATKSVKPGWYLAANGNGSGEFYKFQIVKGQAGLLTIQDENNPPLINGYRDNYGKLKVSLWNKNGVQVEEADIYFGPTYYDEDLIRFVTRAPSVHIYARDGLGASKYQTWCLPAGTYQIAYRKANGQLASASANVTPGQTVHIKAQF